MKLLEAWMKNIKQLSENGIPLHLATDEKGLIGRECPNEDCEGYFKVKFGTGLKGEDLPCHCPYCGTSESQNKFFTKDQAEYINAVLRNTVLQALQKDLKKIEFEHKPKGAFGISLKVQPIKNIPIHKYCEKELETEVICDHCTLHYAVYGVFAVCPDCGTHNALQIFNKNMEIVLKMAKMAEGMPSDISEKILENALEDCISSFDGFGRELCAYADKLGKAKSNKIKKISFQNIAAVQLSISDELGLDIASPLTKDEWQNLCTNFQKRHLFAHKMGVIDSEYMTKSNDVNAVMGRKVILTFDDIEKTVNSLNTIATYLSNS